MIENTNEGLENLNAVRRQVGLDNIPVHRHNYFLHYPLLMDFLKDKFVVEKVHTFDLYYLLTRVFENLLGKFEGYGANAKFDEIFKIADPAARTLFEALGERLSIKLHGRQFLWADPDLRAAENRLMPEPILLLTVLLPVRNETMNLRVMLRILRAVLTMPHEIIVIFDSETDTSIAVVEEVRATLSAGAAAAQPDRTGRRRSHHLRRARRARANAF